MSCLRDGAASVGDVGVAPPETVVIAGVSVRAFGESAVRAGYHVVGIDAFGDLDLLSVAPASRRVVPYRAARAALAARHVPATAVCYTSNFENRPAALRELMQGRVLWGNTPRTLSLARDPLVVANALTSVGLSAARVRRRAPTHGADARTRWLLKPRASGGGHNIVPWSRLVPVRRSHVLQERIAGRPGSILFAADGARAVVLGVTHQLIGRRQFGVSGFRYCGTLLARSDDGAWGAHSLLAQTSAAIASVLTRACGLVGVNGVDAIVSRDRVVAIEVNPRYTAAMELLERRDGLSIFRAHVAGCRRCLDELTVPPASAAVAGKAIVFARRPARIRASELWLSDPDIRDVPAPDSTIPAGLPICTVFATGSTMDACYAGLVERAERIYSEV
jgi:uncharacterized protein